MANLRIQTGTIEGQCVERVLVLTPEGVWTPHPTRGTFQPCGTYPPIGRVSKNNAAPVRKSSMVQYAPGCGPKGCTPQNETLRQVAAFVLLFFVALLIIKS